MARLSRHCCMHFWTLYSVHSLKFLFTFSFSFNREGWPQSFMSKTDCRSGGRAPLTKLLYLGNENVLILSAITWTSFCPFDSNPCHYIIDIWDLTYIMTPVSSLCGLSFCSLPLFLFRFDIYWLIPISRTDYKWKTQYFLIEFLPRRRHQTSSVQSSRC